MTEFKTYYSDRNIPLVYNGFLPRERAIITVENYLKWYKLYLLHPNGDVEAVDFPVMDGIAGSPYIDHVPNPDHVAAWANLEGYTISDQSYEMMIGRWVYEAKEGADILTVELEN